MGLARDDAREKQNPGWKASSLGFMEKQDDHSASGLPDRPMELIETVKNGLFPAAVCVSLRFNTLSFLRVFRVITAEGRYHQQPSGDTDS